ncbi:MAG TPA: hypothetical protein VGQ72_01105 [Pyrinomonadaceae bacterium]|jgi:hypothetical protein|nr:hypothetical protein [Pyrinomonadaceae bacterium]
MKKHLLIFLTPVFLLALLFTINMKLPATGAQLKGIRKLDFDRSSGTVTLQAEEASLTAILSQLRDRHKIEVVVPNLTDRPVTVDIVKAPLPEVLRRILPYGSRFHFVIGEGDISLAGNSGQKKPGRAEVKPRGFPTKDKTPPSANAGPAKLAPERVVLSQTNGARGTKLAPQDSRPETKIKEPRKPVADAHSYARLNLLIKRQGGIEIVRFMEVEGTYNPPTTINGEFIYAAFVGGQVVFVGSIQDPLGVRSYLQDYGHSAEQADSGTFVISLPERFLNRTTLNQSVIRFFYLAETAPRTELLTPQTFPKLRQYLKPAGEIGPRELIAAFGRRYERRTQR